MTRVEKMMPKIKNTIQALIREPSFVAQALRGEYRSGATPFYAAANKIKFWDDDIDGGLEVVLEEHERNPHRRSLEMLGEYYINKGQNTIAEALLRDCFNRFGDIHISNIIFAGIDRTVALVDDNKKILYIALPKCASSTIKNYFTYAKYSATYGEFVHFKHSEMYRIVSPEDLQSRYKDYFKFTVVRDPISRLKSYFTSNISNNALRREAHGNPKFMELKTTPGPIEVAQKFYQYRQMFVDFRHHTDPMIGYLRGMLPFLNNVYNMSDLNTIRELLSNKYDVNIPDERAMVTKKDDNVLENLKEAPFEGLKGFYKEDYLTFFS